jgi:23S rRNA (cytidine2498-2'-O)-methyltransferase
MPDFLFVTCQIGAEPAVKGEMAKQWPKFRFAFSRPGFLTFKLPEKHGLTDDFDLQSVFARAYGFSIGKVTGDSVKTLVDEFWKLAGKRRVQRIHVWERDRTEPGDHGYEPALTPAAFEVHRALLQSCPWPDELAKDADNMNQPAKRHELILDCVMVTPEEWWVGIHRVGPNAARYPGGMMALELPSDVVSRAWLKMEEALRWSRLPMPNDAKVAEIGSAPGGASQALLAHGCVVTGIDPAEMAPEVLSHSRFTHIRKRSTQIRRREFRKIRWLTVDMNVAPNYTLSAVEEIVTHPEVNIRGMLLTLKLPQWSLAEQIPDYIERIRGWGYNLVIARQLQHNRREICVAALQMPFHRKSPMPQGETT